MKLAFHLHAVRAHFAARYPTLDEQARIFDRIHGEGFDGVDISDSWDFSSMDASATASTKKLPRERGLDVATVSCVGKTLCRRIAVSSATRSRLCKLFSL